MKKNLLTALMITAIGATLLVGCGQAEEYKAAEAVTQTVEENVETKEETEEETDVTVETESESENIDEVAEEKDTTLNGADLIVPDESGYTYTVSSKSSTDFDGEVAEGFDVNVVKFDGTLYLRETIEGFEKGSTEYCDITDGLFKYHTIMEGEDWGWDTSSYADWKGYEKVKEKHNIYFENLKDNEWVYVDEEDGNIIYSCKGGKSIHNDSYDPLDPSYISERYYDVEQSIYVDSKTKELTRLIEKYKYEWTTYNYDDTTGKITGMDMTFTSDYNDEYIISDIGTTTVQAPEGMPE